MTAIVGYTNGETVWIGADSAISDGGGGVTSSQDPKVFQIDDYLVGYSGDVRAGQALHYEWEIPRRGHIGLMKFMCSKFVRSLEACLGGGDSKLQAEILVGIRGRLFIVSSDLAVVEEYGQVAAVGSGGDLALGSLLTSPAKLSPGRRLIKALEVAASHSQGVRPPWRSEEHTSELQSH